MSRRGWLAIALLVVWAAALGWHVKRLYLRPSLDLLAEAARTIPPGAAYYAVFRGESRVGWAQNEVDTLPGASGFVVRDRLILREPLLPEAEPLRMEVEARLGPTLSLRAFELEGAGLPGLEWVGGEVHGDTLLELEIGGEAPVRSSLRLEGPIYLAGVWPLRLAAESRIEPGDQFRLPIFDPVSASSTTITFTVMAAERKSYPDSVAAVDGAWVIAREDTVQAWWIEQEIAGIRLRSWIDEDGRLLSAEAPGGIRLERTAFELALFGDSVPETPTETPPSTEADSMEADSRRDGTR